SASPEAMTSVRWTPTARATPGGTDGIRTGAGAAPRRPSPWATRRAGAAAHTSPAHARSASERVAAPAANHADRPAASPAPSRTTGSARPSVTAASGARASRIGSVGPGEPSPPGTQPEVIAPHHDANGADGASAPPASRAPFTTLARRPDVAAHVAPPSTRASPT